MLRRQLTAGAAKNDVETSPAAMASVRVSHGGDIRRMARGCEPVVNRSPNPASLDRRSARAMMARDQQQQAVSACDRLFETAIDCAPRGVEIHAMKVEYALRFNRSAAKVFVPASVERTFRQGLRRNCGRDGPGCGGEAQLDRFYCNFSFLEIGLFARKRPDAGRHPGPELGLLRVERAHGPRPPWGGGPAPGPRLTFPPRSQSRRDHRPKRCRTGWPP